MIHRISFFNQTRVEVIFFVFSDEIKVFKIFSLVHFFQINKKGFCFNYDWSLFNTVKWKKNLKWRFEKKQLKNKIV